MTTGIYVVYMKNCEAGVQIMYSYSWVRIPRWSLMRSWSHLPRPICRRDELLVPDALQGSLTADRAEQLFLRFSKEVLVDVSTSRTEPGGSAPGNHRQGLHSGTRCDRGILDLTPWVVTGTEPNRVYIAEAHRVSLM